jgi:multidrug/hemolysin transport system ATP-binding protein
MRAACRYHEEIKLKYTAAAGEFLINLPDTMAAISILDRCRLHPQFSGLQGSMDDAFLASREGS